MKVLHLDTGFEWRGGQQQVLYLTQGLEELGVTSVVATPQGSPLSKELRDRDLPVIEIPYTNRLAPKTIRSLQRILADRNWHVLHAHTSHAHTLGFLSYRVPPRRSFHRPAFVISRRVDFVPRHDPLTRLKYTAQNQFFICVSEAIRTILEDYGVPDRSLHVVRSGVALPTRLSDDERTRSRSELRAELGLPEERMVIGSIGQFVPHKGHRFLLDAFAEVARGRPDRFHLVLFGDGELEESLREQTIGLGMNGDVTFAGFRPRASRFLPALDMFVHSSTEEGLGTSLLDAGCAEVPIVATRAGGIPEAVEDGVTGLLVEPGNAQALAGAIAELASDPERCRTMGCRARDHVERCFSEKRMVEESLEAYREILGKVE